MIWEYQVHFIRAAFHKIPLQDQEVSALVSVSTIEHADNPSSIFFKRRVKHLPHLPVCIKINQWLS